jgi:ubiquinone/menaquinone biosynthesis C-methylase UbiE
MNLKGIEMPSKRVIETNEGIQDEHEVHIYDQMQRHLRDRGWIETDAIIRSGITSGLALKVGPGPGYLGLEWLKKTSGTNLRGVDISSAMIEIAQRNAVAYQLEDRVQYVQGSGDRVPYDNDYFDAVFTNGSLHEWANPIKTLEEVWRLLKVGGRFFISDLRRDMNFLLKWFLWVNTKPKQIRSGLLTSIKASYKPSELKELISHTNFSNWEVKSNLIGVGVEGIKSNKK